MSQILNLEANVYYTKLLQEISNVESKLEGFDTISIL